jgi:hypothetical protein
MWDIELTPIMGGDVLAGTKATVRSTDFVRVLTGETALATLIRHAVLHHHKLRPAEVLAASLAVEKRHFGSRHTLFDNIDM